jgi:hypothetical protein
MPTREFFLASPFRTVLPLFAIAALLGVLGGLSLNYASAGAGDPDFFRAFGLTIGFAAAAFFLISLLALRGMSRRPYLILDEKSLRMPGTKLAWNVVGEVFPSRWLGQELLRIKSIDDAALVRRFPFPLNFIYSIRIRLHKSPFAVPAVKEASAAELQGLIEQYRASSKNAL